jgi:hypothetical protein
MKRSKLLLAVVGATVLFGALVSPAFAGRLSLSSDLVAETFTRTNFSGGLGTIECDLILTKILHSRSFAKTRLLLLGYIIAANITRCARGGATILRETLPWHIRYDSFSGTLPNITSFKTLMVGFALRVREPTFGIECLARSTPEESYALTYNLSGGVIQSVSLSGTSHCGSSIVGAISGITNNVTDGATARITVTLI